MNKCLFCSNLYMGNINYVKHIIKKRLDKDQYKNFSKNIKMRICSHTIKFGKNKGNICGRISPKINGICSIHKRVGNGVCYIPYCRKTAIEKNLMCQSHTFDATPVCICNKHHYPKKYIKNTFNIPNDILTYFHFP